ncbi:efflux RND transporter periplasmic adaptor subunit [Crocinitomix catalasitica]|uniref:efflux RND transporter periplasmic adaptor subunit n=1 Tax=Crocinitomix catalasitica TaxID=184607 RepID=UPI0004839D33|nr:efflux RND transporter periplasmic adaptor subunit [Crocinitomix catalasitica]
MKKMLACIGLIALFTTFSCKSEHEKSHEIDTKFLVTNPVLLDTFLVKQYVSQIHSIQHIELRAQEHGYLQKIYVDEGQFVKKGQIIFQIMPKLYEAEKQKAQAEVKFAEIEYQNTKKLADNNVVAPNELAMAEAKLDKAKAELALAQVHLDFTEIRAPFDGIIDRFLVREGSLIDEGDLLTNFSDNSKMWVYFNVSESEYLDYQTKLSKDSILIVSLRMANGKMFDFAGRVETIEADFNNETGNIAFRATFPNPNGLLRHGETGSVLVETPMKNALVIPQIATYEILEHKYVFVLDENDVLQARQIKIADEIQHIYIVESGLNKDDKILLDGLRKVKAGLKIDYEFQSPNSVLSNLGLYSE